MGRYLIRRLLWAVVLFFAVTVVSYVLFYLIPANPAKAACGQACTQAEVARVAHFLGTDRPIYVQYGKFVGRLMPVSFIGGPHFKTPSLGNSFYNRQPVNTLVLQAAPVTVSLVFGGVILWLLLAIPIGILSALRPRSLLDRASMTFVLIGISTHPIWIGLIFAYFFGYKLAHHADHGVCRHDPPAPRRTRWARAVGVSHDPPVDDVRDPLRRALRAHDPGERPRDDERGLRPNGARQGRARVAGAALAHPPERHAADRHDARHGHRARPRRRGLHGDDLQPYRAWAVPRSRRSTTTTRRPCWA